MAEEKEEVKEEKPPQDNLTKDLPDNLGAGVNTPDLGASVGPGEDFDDHSDSMTDEEKEAALEAAKAMPADPTKNMSPAEQRDYWRQRANHFESEYKVERTKRQSYDKQYGGLNRQGLKAQQQEERPIDRYTNLDVPDGVQDLKSYTRYILAEAEKAFETKMTEKQLDARVQTSEARAREVHNGEDGLPAYDDLIDEYVVPMIQKNRRVFNIIRELEDPGEASYTLGFILKYKNFADILKSQSRDELIKNINATAKQAATVRGRTNGRQPSAKLTKEEIDRMSPEDFEKELERFRAGSET